MSFADSNAPKPLEEVASELGMVVADYDSRLINGLRELSQRFHRVAPPVSEIGDILQRVDNQHRLFVYEHRYEGTGAYSNGANRHTISVDLLAIAIDVKEARFPAFQMNDDGELLSGSAEVVGKVLPAEARKRLAGWEDVGMAAEGRFVYFINEPPLFALNAVIEQNTSPEFRPGLRNSGLKVDVQRALDIVNMMRPGEPPLAPVYQIEVPTPTIEIPKLNLTQSLSEIRAETHAEIERITREGAVDMEATMEKFRKDREAALAASRERNAAILEKYRKKREERQQKMRDRKPYEPTTEAGREAAAEARRKAQEYLESVQKRLQSNSATEALQTEKGMSSAPAN